MTIHFTHLIKLNQKTYIFCWFLVKSFFLYFSRKFMKRSDDCVSAIDCDVIIFGYDMENSAGWYGYHPAGMIWSSSFWLYRILKKYVFLAKYMIKRVHQSVAQLAELFLRRRFFQQFSHTLKRQNYIGWWRPSWLASVVIRYNSESRLSKDHSRKYGLNWPSRLRKNLHVFP